MKIAIIGSAPSSAGLAPYDDRSWQVWACSPGAVQFVKRSDVWFELHPWSAVQACGLDYVVHLGMHKGPVFLLEPRREVPNGAVFDSKSLVEKFGPYFFTSSPAWMMAAAITELEKLPAGEHKEIGLWGIDMQARGEYEAQRPGCHHFILEARRRGITVTVPPQADINFPPPLYAIDEIDPFQIKVVGRIAELQRKLAEHEQQARRHENSASFYRGALQMAEYFQRVKFPK